MTRDTSQSDENEKLKKNNGLRMTPLLLAVLVVSLAIGGFGYLARANSEGSGSETARRLAPGEVTKLFQSPFTDEGFVTLTGWVKEGIQKWDPCYRAKKEYDLRVTQWSSRLNGMIERKELQFEDLKKIDFSLPDTPGFGDDADNEFFNQSGRFKVFPVPQSVLDELTGATNSKLVFNIRQWISGSEYSELPSMQTIGLAVILPDIKTECGVKDGGWREPNLTKDETIVAPDLQTIVEDKHGIAELRISSDGKHRYMIKILASKYN